MQDKPKFINAKRRGFLQGATVATAAATAAASGTSIAAEPEVIEPTTPEDHTSSTTYRETEVVKLYYRNARF